MTEQETKETKDFSNDMCTDEEVYAEAVKLTEYVMSLINIKLEDAIKENKLNIKNTMHLLGLTGTVISQVIIKDYIKKQNELKEILALHGKAVNDCSTT